jgi:Cu/Ag efflux protein CusF
MTATATIQAIDSTSRAITLRDEKGQEDTYTVGPEVKRFDELKVGDTVKMTYYESIVYQIRKPGEKPGPTSLDAAASRGKAALPSGTVGVQQKMTVTVKAIDPAVPSVTVTTPDGRTVTRKIDDKKNIEGLKVGDQIDITYTQAVVTSVERAK